MTARRPENAKCFPRFVTNAALCQMSETRHEQTFFGTPADRTFNTDSDSLSETKRETTFWGTRLWQTGECRPAVAQFLRDV